MIARHETWKVIAARLGKGERWCRRRFRAKDPNALPVYRDGEDNSRVVLDEVDARLYLAGLRLTRRQWLARRIERAERVS